jgi:hypothetical protein
MRNSIIVGRPAPRYRQPAAFARLLPDAAERLQRQRRVGETDRDRGPGTGRSQQMTLSHPRSVRGLALAAVISALAAPTASAIPAEQFLQDGRGGSSDRAVPVRVVQVGADRGFDWGDAGIGASGLLALMAIGTGAAVATRHRPRLRHNPQPIR